MIDIHTHILPGVDDGAATPEESDRMLAIAVEDGTTEIVATPHCDLRYEFNPERCRELTVELRRRNPEGPRVHLGCELHLTPENVQKALQDVERFALNGGRLVLLELPHNVSPAIVEPAVGALLGSGTNIVIAHPERNAFLQRHLTYMDQLAENGCWLQLTARSVLGGFGATAQSTAMYLLKRRLAHFVASDAHGPVQRRPGLSAAYQAIAAACGPEAAEVLFVRNPAAAVTGGCVRPMPAAPGWFASLFRRKSHRKGGDVVDPVSTMRGKFNPQVTIQAGGQLSDGLQGVPMP